MNPLLHAAELPDFAAIAPEHAVPAVEEVLAEYQAQVDALVAIEHPTWDSLIAPLEAMDAKLERAFSPVSHLHSVMDSPEWRAAHEIAQDKITEFTAALGQNRALYEAYRKLKSSPEFAHFPRERQAVIEHALRDFELSGVALDEPMRTRFRDIARESTQLETAFEQAVMDATDAWQRPLSETELDGIPDSERAVLAQAARDKQQDGHLLTLQQPAYHAVITYARNRELRAEAYRAYQTRASDQGPHAGQFDNAGRIEKIMALRHEAAQLLGFPNAAAVSLATKMAPNADRVLAFLRDLAAKAKPGAERDLAELRAFAASELGIDELQPWDVAYASEKLRERRYALSDEELKPYFPLDAVMAGLFRIVEEAFGARIVPRGGVSVWHADVQYCDVLAETGERIAGLFLDPYARAKKRGGAWMDTCRSRFVSSQGSSLPIAYLTCNFAPPTPGKPSLLTHDDVTTLFHEFGHGLHHMLTRIDARDVSGISGVEWDAVELPSQFMENFCWTRAGLDRFARHVDTGAAMPDDLFQRLLATRHFQSGLFLVRQLEFGLFDFLLHLNYAPERGARVLETLAAVREEVAVIRPPEWQRFPMSFGHIFAGGYAAGYYSYLWAEVLSADAFAAFGDGIDASAGRRFLNEVLSVGGSRPALESFVAFRGREPIVEPLLASYGLAA